MVPLQPTDEGMRLDVELEYNLTLSDLGKILPPPWAAVSSAASWGPRHPSHGSTEQIQIGEVMHVNARQQVCTRYLLCSRYSAEYLGCSNDQHRHDLCYPGARSLAWKADVHNSRPFHYNGDAHHKGERQRVKRAHFSGQENLGKTRSVT